MVFKNPNRTFPTLRHSLYLVRVRNRNMRFVDNFDTPVLAVQKETFQKANSSTPLREWVDNLKYKRAIPTV